MKRQRGRGRKPGGGHHNHHQPNRTMESSGPDTKVRGPASHIYERYLQLARDAASSGDRVLSENYLQHADHYFRLVRAMQPAMPVQPVVDRLGDADIDGDEEGGAEAEAAEEGEASAEGAEQPDVDFPQGQPAERGEGEFRRRRRRGRFRPEGESAEAREGGGERRDGGERREGGEERRQRREGDQSGGEGFSHGPKPAFLRD